MKKAEFIKAVAENLGTSQKEARETIEKVFETIEEGLVAGKTVPLGNLGKFEVVERAARTGHNPQTGEKIEIPARNAVRYKPSKHAKEVIQ